MAHNKFADAQEVEIARKYQNGKMISELADEYRCGRKAIRSALIRQGLSVRHGGPNACGRFFDDDGDRKVRKLYNSGKSIAEITKIYNLGSLKTVNQSLKRTGDRRPNRTYFFDEHVFDMVDTEEKAYWLGFLYADGSPGDHQIRLALSVRDQSHLEKFRSFFGDRCPPMHGDGKACWVTLSSRHLVDTIAQYGIVIGRNQFFKMKNVLHSDLHRHFIRGCIDGDGFISPNGNVGRIGLLSQEDVLIWTRNVFHENLGVSHTMKIEQRQGIYQITWGGKYQFKKIVAWLYDQATIYLERKYQTALNYQT